MMVKICGITNREDALAAIERGALALGFNFYPKSSRYVADREELVGSILGVIKVGVFVNEPPRKVAETARRLGLDAVQLHGEEAADQYPAGPAVWKAVRVENGFRLSDWEKDPAEVLLLDGPAGSLFGGAGAAFDWNLAAGCRKKIMLAGGLDADNVRQAIAAARPWGVDACSRLESAPGKKDHKKMAAFLKAALAPL
jgi:phosphoribosylanthranilate isomerase